MSTHFKRICECGKVMNQCRCIGPHSIVIQSPCIHVIAEPVTSDPISYQTLIDAKNRLEEMGEIANILTVHPSTYNAIMIYFDNKEVEDTVAGVKKQPQTTLGNLFDVPILIDNSLKPGEWRFERRFYD